MKSIAALIVFLAVPCRGGQAPWDHLPTSVTIPIQATQLSIPQNVVESLEKDISQQRDFQITWENSQADRRFGVDHEWMNTAVQHWRDKFSWRDAESSINRHPHFTANISVDATELQVHFMALFSKKTDAVPIAFFHSWPGSFLEFMDILDNVKSRYDPDSSPYHLIVPSLPGFTFSSGPPVDSNWGIANTSVVMDSLLRGLGFEHGYVAQGGDIGSFVARTLALTSSSCKAVHLNFIPSVQPPDVPDPQNDTSLTPQDRQVLTRSQEFINTKQAYALEQGTKPATLGFVLSHNPIGLLAWIGEKFLAWTDPSRTLTLDQILTHISTYHLTQTTSRSLYAYRETSYSLYPEPAVAPRIEKPMGYSRFPYDNSGVPESWVGNLVFYKAHERGGHFPALECPTVLWEDVESFVQKIFPDSTA
ncbi:hypothetical protein N0V84_002877 [Fusarium piperis]|uniref:Epoxide hydrolase N-terminal domain-containing protein n=1 Tax=Fusarium piperis TaxID=1435070 RepID=A0A9W8WIV0_9HYPO|nr:hypothetical protein N0V84_002877 [Fusarium piperis]